jgi:tetratricopeptide (TPR) repeat protein
MVRHRSGRSSRCVLLVVVALSTTGISPAQQPAKSYRDVAAEYLRNPDEGLRLLSAVPADAVEQGITAALTDVRWTENDLRAAAVMHTDAWLRELKPFERGHSDQIPKENIAAAARLLRHALSTSEGQWFAFRWFDALVRAIGDISPREPIVQDRVVRVDPNTPSAEQLAEKLTDSFGEQPCLYAAALFDRALASEFYAIQWSAAVTRPGSVRYDPQPLREAAAGYEEALAQMPEMTLAALHLGRIRLLQNRTDEAGRLLGIAAASRTRSTIYVASLYLGSIAEREGRFAEAEDRYRAAILAAPRGQSAHMALAQLHSRLGRPDDSRRILDNILSDSDPFNRVDPWWSYLPEDWGKDPATTVAAMRYELLR